MFLMFAPLALVAATVAPSGTTLDDYDLSSVPRTAIALAAAELDLELRMDELDLIGSAPLFGADWTATAPAPLPCPTTAP
jgi:hypothetical protein